MPHCLRLAVVAMAILILTIASHFTHLARADDPAPAAHESTVLDRIFGNWKARHGRIRSIHFTWDCRSKYPAGTADPTSRVPSRLERDQEFEQFGVRVWIDGERICWINTPSFKVPAPKTADRGHVDVRWVSDGKTDSYILNTVQQSAPGGFILQSSTADESPPIDTLQPLLLAFRPQHAWVSWRREKCRLSDENASVDNGQFAKIQRIMEQSNIYPRREEACWVSAARDDVIVHWTIQCLRSSWYEGSIKYKKDKTHGWIPSEWSFDHGGRGRVHHTECKVTSYAINERIDPATFTLEFPAGTVVSDNLNRTYYLLQPDGSKKTLSQVEYSRLSSPPASPKKKAPAKPQTK